MAVRGEACGPEGSGLSSYAMDRPVTSSRWLGVDLVRPSESNVYLRLPESLSGTVAVCTDRERPISQ